MACGSGSRTNWIAIHALQCYLRHLAHRVAQHGNIREQTDKVLENLALGPLGSLGCFRIVLFCALLRILGAYSSFFAVIAILSSDSGFCTIRPNDFPGGPQPYDEKPSRDSLGENCWIPQPNSTGNSYLGPWWTMSHKPARTATFFSVVRCLKVGMIQNSRKANF